MKTYTSSLPVIAFLSILMLSGCKQDLDQNSNQHLIIKNPMDKPLLIILNNPTNHVIYLNRANKNPGASAGWMSQLDPGKYSALLTKQNSFIFTCQNEKYKNIDCRHSVTSTVKPLLNRNTTNQGSYWITENKTKQEIHEQLVKEKF